MRNVHFHPWALGSVSPGCNEIRGRHRVQWTHQLPVTPPPHHHRISTQLATQSSHTVKSHSPLVTQSYGHTVILSHSHIIKQSSGHTVIFHSQLVTQSYSTVIQSHHTVLFQSPSVTQSYGHTVIWSHSQLVSQRCYHTILFVTQSYGATMMQ